MPLAFPTPTGFSYFPTNDDSPSSGTAFGTSVAASASANTKGAWTQLLSATTYDIFEMSVVFTAMNTSAANDQGLVDLGIGPDASNVTVIAQDLLASMAPNWTGGSRQYLFPLFVPQGTLLWARVAASTGSDTVMVAVHAFGGVDRPGMYPIVTLIESMGATAASTTGTTLTPGTSGALGAYAQMSASAPSDYIGLMMAHTQVDTTMANIGHLGNCGIGAATEQDLGTCYFAQNTSAEAIASLSIPALGDIPAGTRVAARMTCTGTPDSSASAIAYGLRAA